MARDLRVNPPYRLRKGKSRLDLEQQADRWSRAAKHKPPKPPGSEHGPDDFGSLVHYELVARTFAARDEAEAE